MKQTICVIVALLLLLSGCSMHELTPTPTIKSEKPYTHDIFELTFSLESIDEESISGWDVIYSHSGEIITSGHQTLLSIEVFTFYAVQATFSEKGNPENAYNASMSVALCDGGSGKTEVTVTSSDGKVSTFKVICTVQRVGRS